MIVEDFRRRSAPQRTSMELNTAIIIPPTRDETGKMLLKKVLPMEMTALPPISMASIIYISSKGARIGENFPYNFCA